MKGLVALLLISCFASGCTTAQYERGLAKDSSSAVGCPPEEIAIKDRHAMMGGSRWKAECRGSAFFCTQQVTYDGVKTGCTKEVQASK